MKKLSILLLSAVALFSTFTSCSDDDNNTPAAPSLIGKWEWKQVLTYTDGVPDPIGTQPWPEGLSDLVNDTQCGAADLITFTTNTHDNTGAPGSVPPAGAKRGVYADSYTNATTPCTVGEVNFGYTLSGTTLTIYNLYTAPAVFTVDSVTETELKITSATTASGTKATYTLARKS